MMFLVQCIDDTGRTIDDDVTGFRMNRDGAEAMCRFFNGLGYAAVSRWVVAMAGDAASGCRYFERAELGALEDRFSGVTVWAGLSYIVVPVEGGEE